MLCNQVLSFSVQSAAASPSMCMLDPTCVPAIATQQGTARHQTVGWCCIVCRMLSRLTLQQPMAFSGKPRCLSTSMMYSRCSLLLLCHHEQMTLSGDWCSWWFVIASAIHDAKATIVELSCSFSSLLYHVVNAHEADQEGMHPADGCLTFRQVILLQGGATRFEHLNLAVQPRKGMALLFFPSFADGTPDDRQACQLSAADPAMPKH